MPASAAPLGRMAFTNYLAQSVIFGWIFYGYGRVVRSRRSNHRNRNRHLRVHCAGDDQRPMATALPVRPGRVGVAQLDVRLTATLATTLSRVATGFRRRTVSGTAAHALAPGAASCIAKRCVSRDGREAQTRGHPSRRAHRRLKSAAKRAAWPPEGALLWMRSDRQPILIRVAMSGSPGAPAVAKICPKADIDDHV
jgi:hypothetical protein